MKRNATVPADFYDALKRQCAASKRELRRLRGWLRWWNSDTMFAEVSTGQIRDALRGKPAPRGGK
jgi:hypothetical protein